MSENKKRIVKLPAAAANVLRLALRHGQHPLAQHFLNEISVGETTSMYLNEAEQHELYRYASGLADGDYWGHAALSGGDNRTTQRSLRLAEKRIGEQLYVNRYYAQVAVRFYDPNDPAGQTVLHQLIRRSAASCLTKSALVAAIR